MLSPGQMILRLYSVYAASIAFVKNIYIEEEMNIFH